MSELLLVSAGENIRCWDSTGYTQIQQFNPHAGNISSIRWSHDNTALASASTCGDKIVLTYTNSAAYSNEIAVGEKKTCLAFNSTSRYIMGGGPDGIIHVWDLKTQKRKNSYKDHKSKITSLQFNWNDTVIASGADNGDIIVYNVVTAVGSSPLRTPKTQAICELQYSHFKKSLLASASDDGAVNLWDTNTRRLLHSFSDSHKAPATGLAFSPLNEMLLMSVGLDKRIVCYDVQGKVAVKTMMAESPLTSIDLSHDGATLAVGSSRGKIYIYDLRQGATPVRVMAEHKSSVQGLHFQCPVKNAKSDTSGGKLRATTPTTGKRPSSTSSANNSNGTKLVPTSNGVAHHRANTAPENRGLSDRTNLTPTSSNRQDGKGATRAHSRDSGHLTQDYGAEIFSPIREPYNYRSDDVTSLAENMSLSENRPQSPRAVTNHSAEPYSDAVFSPLADGLSLPLERSRPVGSSTGYSPQHIAAETEPFSRPVRRHSSGERVLAANFSHEFAGQMQAAPHGEDNVQSQSSSLSSSRGDVTSGEDQGSYAETSNERSTQRQLEGGQLREDLPRTVYGNFPSIKVSSPGSLPMSSTHQPSHHSHAQSVTTPPDATPSAPEGGAAAAGPLVSGAQPFQTQFIKNLINEALDDFREQVRQDVLNLHMEMLKQFQIQQTQTKSLLQQYSVNGELLAEIERLREENAKLRKNF